MDIHITHCSATKDNSLQHSKKRVTPGKLYTSKVKGDDSLLL